MLPAGWPYIDIARGAAFMSVRIFMSTMSDEFHDYRDQLCHDLMRHNGEVKVQEDFKELGTVTLDKLDVYITKLRRRGALGRQHDRRRRQAGIHQVHAGEISGPARQAPPGCGSLRRMASRSPNGRRGSRSITASRL
jgi:hypothetical protein